MKLDHSDYTHISFDLWLTLIKSNPEFKQKRNLLFKDYFKIDSSITKVAEVVRYYDLLCNNVNEKTGLNFATNEIYYLILNSLEVDIGKIDLKSLENFYLETELLFMEFKPVLIYPKIELLFSELVEQQKSISILSNTGFISGGTLRKLLRYYDLDKFFSFQIYSDEVGMSKPNPRIFKIVYNEICLIKEINRAEVLHIGDNMIADYNGAREFGFNSLLIKQQ